VPRKAKCMINICCFKGMIMIVAYESLSLLTAGSIFSFFFLLQKYSYMRSEVYVLMNDRSWLALVWFWNDALFLFFFIWPAFNQLHQLQLSATPSCTNATLKNMQNYCNSMNVLFLRYILIWFTRGILLSLCTNRPATRCASEEHTDANTHTNSHAQFGKDRG